MIRLFLCVFLLSALAVHQRRAEASPSGLEWAIVVPFLNRRRPPRSGFGEALDAWLEGAAPVENLIDSIERTPLEQPEDLEAVLALLAAFRAPDVSSRRVRRCHRALPEVVLSLLEPPAEPLADAIRERILPEAGSLFEFFLARRGEQNQEGALLLLRLLVAFGGPAEGERLVRAVRLPLLPDHQDWEEIFAEFTETHPAWPAVVAALADPLPPGFIAIVFLDTLNDLAVAGQLDRHPFASEEGCRRLDGWLRSPRPELYSYALSATTALPFVGRRDRERLLPLARRHPDEEVRLEAAWVAAATGDESGIRDLAGWALDIRRSRQACQYLHELQREDAIPDTAKAPDFEAVAALTAWLALPEQFGVYPDRVEIVDRRKLFWPPAGERIELRLLHYSLEVDGYIEEGVGIVGEMTFALLDEPTAELSHEDIYGLYCAWEMIYNNSPDAPEDWKPATGRAILARHNPGFPVRDE